MQTKEQTEKAHMVFVRDTNSGIISRIAFPEDVQVGLSNKPSELMLTGRLSLSTTNYACNPGSEITINNDTIYALVSATSSQSGSLIVKLPTTPRNGQWVIVKDASGNASNQNIIVKPQNSSIKIDGLAQSIITSPYGSFAVIWKDGEWKGAFGRSGDGTPGGVNKQVQFNDDGMFGGDPYFLFDKTNHSLTASNTFITGNLNVKGYVQINSIENASIPADKTAGYLYLSGSTQDIYFTQYDPTQTYNSTTRLRWLESELSTGLLHGGVLWTQNGSTTFCLGSGSGIFVNFNASLGNDPYPTVKLVEWQPFVSESLTYVSSKQISYIGIDSNKNIVQRSSPFTVSDAQDYIFLGRILHQFGSVTNGAVTSPHVAYGSNQWQHDYIKSLGPLKISGHVLSAAGANLQLNKTNGTSFVFGRNYTYDPNSPNIVPPANDYAVTVSKIFREYVDGSGNPVIDSNSGAGYSVIDPTQYNNGGTLAAVASGKFTVQRAYWYPASVNKAIYVYYGNAIYNSIADASSGFDAESFVEGDNTSTEAILLGYIIVKANATDLTNTSDAVILQAGPLKFSGGGGGGGGGGTTVPGGTNTDVQFNDGGAFGGESSFTYNKTTNTLTVDNLSGSLTKLSNGTSYLIAGSGISITTGSNGAITITNDGTIGDITSVTAGIGLTGGGTSGNVTLNINDSVVATISGTTFTGITKHNLGLSGSLTQLINGTSYLIAGNNVTIATGSTGAVTIAAPNLASNTESFLTLGNTTGLSAERAFTPGIGLTGTDGGANSTYTLGINNSVVATVSGTTFTGVTIHNVGLSGSLTRLTNGSSYLIADSNITITSASNGSVTIKATPSTPTNSIQYNNNGTFAGSSGFTFDGRLYLSSSFEHGLSSRARGQYSHAEGLSTYAIGNYSHSEGEASDATGLASHAEGFGGVASGDYSHAEGYGSQATAIKSHAEGSVTVASGIAAHSEGSDSVTYGSNGPVASGEGSHAEGTGTTSSGDYSHAEGIINTSSGAGSHAEGKNSSASAEASHAEGYSSTASGQYSHAEGSNTIAKGIASHAEGYGSRTEGNYSHASGYYTIASGTYQNVVGKYNKRDNVDSLFIVGNGSGDSNSLRDDIFIVNSGSVLIGSNSLGSDVFFFVSGSTNLNSKKSVFSGNVFVSGTILSRIGLSGSLTQLVDGTSYIIAGSNVTIASASNGSITVSAPNLASSATAFITVGNDSTLSNERSLTAGTGLIAIDGGANSTYTLSINDSTVATVSGTTFTGVTKHNLGLSGSLTKLTDGTSYLIAGSNVTISSASNGSVTIAAPNAAPGGSNTHIQYNNSGNFAGSANFTYNGSSVYLTGALSQGFNTQATGLRAHAEGLNSIASGQYSHAEGAVTTATNQYSHAEGSSSDATGQASHAEGSATTASGASSHSEGESTTASGQGSHAEGYNTIASGPYSHAEGALDAFTYFTNAPIASGFGSHAEGTETNAGGDFSHAEGFVNSAWGVGAHAEGTYTVARGDGSHSEGYGTEAFETYSHAAGIATIASGSGQNVVGKYNKRDNADSLFIVGNGSGDDNSQRDDILLVNTGSVLIGSASLATDTFFYVGTKGTANTALFAGNAQISGTLKSTLGLSGSLTKLIDGTSYLIAGSNVTITSASNGAVTIATTGGSPGGSNTHVQYNNGGSFAGSANFTFNGSAVFLTGSFSQGSTARAIGTNSHAEGQLTTATGQYSHAEGQFTNATNSFSHAEGNSTTASGQYSHAEGDNTVAIGNHSHTSGIRTIASGSGQVVVGKYNKRNNTDSLFIVGDGNGDANEQRDDIFLVNSGSVLIGSGNISSDTAFFVTGPSSRNKSVFQGNMIVSGNIYGRYAGNNVLTNSSIGRVITSITSSYSNTAPATTAGAVVANITLPAYTFINTGDRVKCTFEIEGQGTLGTRSVNTYLSGSSGRTQIGTKTNAGNNGSVYVNDFSITRSGTNSQISRGVIIDSGASLPTRISGSTSHDETQAIYVILELTASSVATDARLVSYGVTFQGT